MTTRRGLRRAAALVCTAALVVTLVGGCGSSGTPSANAGDAGVHINTNTPPGVRAQQVMDMLNSDWPIGPVGIKTLTAPDLVDSVGTTMDGMWYDRPYTIAGVEIGAGAATLHIVSSYGARQDIELHTDDSLLVDRFKVTTQTPQIKSWADVDAVLSKTGAKYSYRVSRVNDGKCDQFAGTNTTESLPLASIFKTYVLYAVGEEITAGRLSWDDQLTITAEGKAVGSSGFDKLPPGTQVSVRTAAQKMISNSDNMATDMLIERVGIHAVERALADAGHHDPASMTPFPTMHELFSIGWGKPDLRDQWQHANAAGRAALLKDASSRPYEPDPLHTRDPGSAYGIEWYGSAEDICRVHAALQTAAVGPAAPIKEIMSAISGIDLDRQLWPYIGAKAGNLPGDLTFSWYAVDRTGQPWVLSLQMNWPRFHGPGTAGWLMTIIKQMFALIPVGQAPPAH
ncbi:serine hydrolase [Mycolicibacterium komossense]|uniref:serine hydrolase n=1 Tax=Mycolicibacterium komossense TaxID=1779 RepID=UPI0021F349FB|nr:serine hydrolase [Mycolicibacterium komossense]